MREIKFRAKYLPNDEDTLVYPGWLYGSSPIVLNNGKTAMFHLNDNDLPTITLVIPESIGEQTSLKDKNGLEIYEGDIVNKRYENLSVFDGIGAVEMGQGSDSDGWAHGEWLGWKAGNSSLLDVAGECEVIGNIYENPELLK